MKNLNGKKLQNNERFKNKNRHPIATQSPPNRHPLTANKNVNNLIIDFKSKFENKIIILKNSTLNLFQIVDNKNIDEKIEITLDDNSTLNIYQFIFNCKSIITNVILKRNSKYNLKSAYYLNNSNSYIFNYSIHKKEYSYSNMNIKGAVFNNSKVICNGLIKIEKVAKKSEGHQNITGLILDKDSSISSEPILEIENNNIKCSHGCSISQINEEVLFYMQNRGISKKESINLILKGIFNELVTNIKDTKIKKRVMDLINKKLK